MNDIKLNCQVAPVLSDTISAQDWTSDAENLLQSLGKDTAKLLEAVKNHFLKIGKASRKIFDLAESAQESKQAQIFFKQNFNSALRKDLEKGRRLWDYTQQFDVEDDIRFVLSGTGFDTGNSILGKLPDTLSKVEFPGVLKDPIAKKLDVAAGILSELVEITLKEKEGIEKNGVKSSDIARLIKLNSVPNCDRVEFKEAHTTYRAEVAEYCPDTDVIKVRIDGSGEEKEIPRGTIALKEQKAPKLHEPCLVQGDEVEHYNKCGILKALLSDDKALVLLLDGRLIEVPKKAVVKGKKGSPIPELLYLLDESGNADKVSLAVEKAVEKTSKSYEKRIDELTTEAGKAWSDGRDSLAAETRAMQPKIPFDMFLSIPVPEKLAIFAAQPDEAKNLILANYVKSLPPVEKVDVVEIQASAAEALDRPVVDVKAVEVEAPVAEPESDESITARFAKKGLTETLPVASAPPSKEESLAAAEIEYQQAVDALKAKKEELGLDPDSDLISHAAKRQCESQVKAQRVAESRLQRIRLDIKAPSQPAVVKPEPAPRDEVVFSKEDVELADKLLIKGYREIEILGKRVDLVLSEVEKEFPQLKEFLVSTCGQEWLCLYYLKNAAYPTAIVHSVILDKKEAEDVVQKAIDCIGELDKLTQYYRSGNRQELEKVDMRLKKIAQLLLTKEEVTAIKAAAAKPPTQVATPVTQEPVGITPSKEEVREWLCHPKLMQDGITWLETNDRPLTEILSASQLQAMYDGGGTKQINAIALVSHFKCENLINFESIFNPKPIAQKSPSPKAPQFPSRKLTEDTDEIPGGF